MTRFGQRLLPYSCLLALATAADPARAQPSLPRTGDDLLGLWGAEPHLGPQIRGLLRLDRAGDAWTVRVAGFEHTATAHGDSVVMALPGGQGTLKLWLTTSIPEAYWVQPAGTNQAFASPVRLEATGSSSWRGHVAPVAEQFPLYLMVTRADDGALRATFRNPEVNWPGRTPSYLLERAGPQVVFRHPRTGAVQWSQPYDSARRTIAFDFGAPIVLTPRTLEQAIGFVPRSPSALSYHYRVPTTLGDGWRPAAAGVAGMDAERLQSIVRSLVAIDPLSETAPRVHAVVVARRGRLVLDEYFRGYDVRMMHDLRSASKTVTSIMLGVAMQQGATLNGKALTVDTPVGGEGMTLGHLLSHSTGLACNDDDEKSPGNEDTMQSQTVQTDWYRFFQALPRIAAPGRVYSYCSAGINMAGGLIAQATQQWLPRLFERRLAKPLAFGEYAMNLMPDGRAYAGGGMRMLPRDLLKLGQLYLDGGVWRGQQLVPAAWVRRSTSHVIGRDDGSDDGYGWHRHIIEAAGRRYQTYEAGGNGGQLLVVVPDLQLVMAFTAGNYGQYPVWRNIREQLVPAIMEAAR